MIALGFEETYAAIRGGVAGTLVPVEVVRVVGPEALSYLQGQVSQDLDQVGIGGSAEALVLSPQGKLDALVRVARTGEDEALVVVDDGFGEALFDRLRRFKVRVKADLELVRSRAAVVRGPDAKVPSQSGGAAVIVVDYPGYSGFDLVGLEVELPGGVPAGDPAAFEVARIEAGAPTMGREITERTIPQEAGIVARTVSFSKGCYTGQELVARIDARGNRVPRRLVGIVVEGDDVEPADLLMREGKEVGSVTSSAFSPRINGAVALGYLRREVEVPAEVEIVHDGRVVAAEVLALPLYGA
ncbi:MAG TPA: glycine cleavage T C-terminal barrel domain-containing protein [Acidimicrobiales bacterium]|nr:glycine cleavage T C-terminal barrel domain-containing protein [Acidimicrobiales bacterium]